MHFPAKNKNEKQDAKDEKSVLLFIKIPAHKKQSKTHLMATPLKKSST
jgi:hypothetical protein